MALTLTTLAAAVTKDTLRFYVTASTGATVGGVCKVDNEYSVIEAIPLSGVVDVRSRGDRGGMAIAHDILAPVVFCLASDLADLGTKQDTPVPGDDWDVLNVGQNGVIAVPKKNTIFNLNKGAALASTTLADPGKDQDGLTLVFLTTTDYAHVITTVSLHDGTTGAHTTATSAAYAGASLTVTAAGGKWMITANNNWTIT